jgi:hypothetical protein
MASPTYTCPKCGRRYSAMERERNIFCLSCGAYLPKPLERQKFMSAVKDCPRLMEKTAEEISTFLIKHYNSEKIPFDIKLFEEMGFTKVSLLEDRDNLFKFLVLVAYDRRPFWPWEIVWDRRMPRSVCNVLKARGLFDVEKVRKIGEEELEKILRQCVTEKNLYLNTNGAYTRFARTMKEIAERLDQIKDLLSNMKTGLDAQRLHSLIDNIHGFGPTMASKFIMYTVREIGVGSVPRSELNGIAKYLWKEWHNSQWAQRLRKKGLLEDVIKRLSKDPMAFDYFFYLDRYYCKQNRCQSCIL